jgi:integrase
MASILQMPSGRWRALVRKGGHSECDTFDSQAAAKSWARRIEAQVDELKATGRMQPKGVSLGDLIDRYTREIHPIKPWGRSKTADLKRLKADIGHLPAGSLDHKQLFDYFIGLRKDGSGPVVIAGLVGYLVGVIETASSVWRLAVPVDTVTDVRDALKKLGMVRKSEHRDRRVSDAELEQVIPHLTRRVSSIALADVVWFCLASAMRISEVTRLQWSDLNEDDKTIRIRARKHPTLKQTNDQIVPLLLVAGHDAFAIVQRQPKREARIFPANSRTVSDYFTQAVTDSGLEDLHLHDLRHESISRLFEAGFRIEQVALVSGHRDWGQLKRYTHIKAVDLHRAPAT